MMLGLNKIALGFLIFLGSFWLAFSINFSREESAEFSSFSGPSWLVVGDSHTVGAFGDGLRQGMVENLNNSNLYFYAATGSRFEHWQLGKWDGLNLGSMAYSPVSAKVRYKGFVNPYWKLDSFINQTSPKNIVIALGTNDMALYYQKYKKNFSGINKDNYFSQIQKYIQNKNIKNCYWVIPTIVNTKLFDITFQNMFYDKLTSQLQKYCQVIDSRKYRKEITNQENQSQGCRDNKGSFLYPTSRDQIHFLKADGEYWGACVAKEISQIHRN
jgi:lysophospholipase L1-like esterase